MDLTCTATMCGIPQLNLARNIMFSVIYKHCYDITLKPYNEKH